MDKSVSNDIYIHKSRNVLLEQSENENKLMSENDKESSFKQDDGNINGIDFSVLTIIQSDYYIFILVRCTHIKYIYLSIYSIKINVLNISQKHIAYQWLCKFTYVIGHLKSLSNVVLFTFSIFTISLLNSVVHN